MKYNVMDINCFSKDFFKITKELYEGKVIFDEKSGKEVLETLNEEYGITQITLENVDYWGKRHLGNFEKTINNEGNKGLIHKCNFNIYKLNHTKASKKYYDYFYRDFSHYPPEENIYQFEIYIFHELNNDILTSNSSFLSTKILILKGIDKSEINDNIIKYATYLNYFYVYDITKYDLNHNT